MSGLAPQQHVDLRAMKKRARLHAQGSVRDECRRHGTRHHPLFTASREHGAIGSPRARSPSCWQGSHLEKAAIDGLCFSSFTLAPDTAVGLTQHLGLSLRWLDHIPMGGAAGIVALRRASRAVESGDADVVACIAADTNATDTFRSTLGNFSQFTQDAVWPYGAGGPNASFALLTSLLHARVRRAQGGFRQAVRRAAGECAELPAGACSASL